MDDKEKIKILEKENERLRKKLELRALSADDLRTTQTKLNEAIESVNQQRKELKEYTDKYKELCNEMQVIKTGYKKSVKKVVRDMNRKWG